MAHFGGETKAAAVRLVFALRAAGIGARLAFARHGRSLKSQLREADRQAVSYAFIIGADELARGEAAVKSLRTDEPQAAVSLDEAVAWLQARGVS